MDIFILSAIISLLALDITIAFQVLISSPIFACPLLGWLLGDVRTGFELGFLFQLLWLGRIPAGAYIVPEGNIASMVATALVLLYGDAGYPNTTLVVVFLEALFISYLGAHLTLVYRKLNGKILNLIENQVRKIHFNVLILLEASSMVLYFLMVYIIVLVFLRGNQFFLSDTIHLAGQMFEKQFIVIKPVLLGLGVAAVYPLFKEAIQKKSGKNVGSKARE